MKLGDLYLCWEWLNILVYYTGELHLCQIPDAGTNDKLAETFQK